VNSNKRSAQIDFVSLAQALMVEDHFSFRKAASALGVQQSAINQRMQRLEDLLPYSFAGGGAPRCRASIHGGSLDHFGPAPEVSPEDGFSVLNRRFRVRIGTISILQLLRRMPFRQLWLILNEQ
jgi:hypothetical protein